MNLVVERRKALPTEVSVTFASERDLECANIVGKVRHARDPALGTIRPALGSLVGISALHPP